MVARLPAVWKVSGSNLAGYEAGVDGEVKYRGKASGFVRSKPDDVEGMATLRPSPRRSGAGTGCG